MSSSLEYIDSYFENEMPSEERQIFELRCEQDAEFAREVSSYIASRNYVKSVWRDEKRREFASLYKQHASDKQYASGFRRVVPFVIAIAASLLIFVLFIVNNAPSAEKLASQYIEENFSSLSVAMGGENDLQTGITAFNKKDYPLAAEIFKELTARPDIAAEATRYLGITFLLMDDYDQAIRQFDTLAAWPGLYVNHGKFYGALARLKRSSENDKEEAMKLLQEVIANKLPGSNDAADWIDKLK
jgi:tetratricopeptide (TPR) repeat protein